MNKTGRVLEILEDRGLDLNDKSLYQLETEIKRCRLFLYKTSPSYAPKEYVSFEEGCTAYEYVLVNACPSEEALEVCRVEHNKDGDWLEDVKNRKFFYSKQVVDNFDDHPVQKRMLKDGTMDKQALKGSGTVNQQIRRLSQYRAIQDRLDSLQQAYDNLTKTVNSLEDRIEGVEGEVRDAKLSNIKSEFIIDKMKALVGYQDNPKELARVMKERGHTQKEVSESTGKSLPTIKRWWKEF